MRLWTTMPKSVYDKTLAKNGVYACDANKCDMLLLSDDSYKKASFKKAYLWMADEMRVKIGPAPRGIQYPVWAWFRLRGKEAKPDLRWREFQNAPVPMVLLELEIEENRVVLSNERQWKHALLNDTACCDTQEEFDWYYDSDHADAKEKEAFKVQSWRRIFDTQSAPNVQAVFWEIRTDNVKRVWEYNKSKTEQN